MVLLAGAGSLGREQPDGVLPFALVEEGERITVTSRLVGNFPGSPVDLDYRFVLEGDKIARLEIAP